jgi:hypothetical protein
MWWWQKARFVPCRYGKHAKLDEVPYGLEFWVRIGRSSDKMPAYETNMLGHATVVYAKQCCVELLADFAPDIANSHAAHGGPHPCHPMSLAQVVNHRDVVVVDRTSVWGNPFKIGKDGDRASVIAKYRRYFYHPDRVQLRELAVKHLRGKSLMCWCAPLACHADVLLEWANASPRERAMLLSERRSCAK